MVYFMFFLFSLSDPKTTLWSLNSYEVFVLKVNSRTGAVYIGLSHEPATMVKAARIEMNGDCLHFGVGIGNEVIARIEDFRFHPDDILSKEMQNLEIFS